MSDSAAKMNVYYPTAEAQKNVPPDLLTACRNDPQVFIDQFCWTFDPRPDAKEHTMRFLLYPFQRDYLIWIIRSILAGKDGLTEKSRDMGVTWLHMAAYLWCWFFVPGFQCLIGSRKEDLVDNGMTDSLFGKIDFMLDKLPFQPKGYNHKKHRAYMRLINPENGNAIKGESANTEFSRQGRYTVVFMDELAFWERPESGWIAAGEATRCRMAVTTPPKQGNFVTAMRKLIVDKQIDIQLQTLHWRLHPLKDEAWYIEQKKRKTAVEVAQELDINWEGSITNRVYPEYEHVRIGKFDYRPDWPLYVSHDPGATDPYALCWWQADKSTGRYRLIDSFERPNRIVKWFAPLFGQPISSEFSYSDEEMAFIKQVGGWQGAIHYGDPAGESKNGVTGTSPYDAWRDYDIYIQTNTKSNNHEARITALKHVLMRLDINDTPRNRYWLECIKNTKLPDLTENSQRVTPNVKPIHDWTSHLRTAAEYFAVNFEWEIKEEYRGGLTFERAAAMLDRKAASRNYIGNETI